MKFYHEILQHDIDRLERQVSMLKADLNDHTDSRHKNIVWELRELLHDTLGGTTFDNPTKFVTTYIHEPAPLSVWQQLYDDIDDILYNYYLDTETPSYTNKILLEYINKDDQSDKIIIEVENSSCEQIPTGRMVPEYKKDCNLVKV